MMKHFFKRISALGALFLLALPLTACHMAAHRAAVNGEARAQFDLAERYDEGRGVRKDVAKAAQWYRKAAEGGLPEAQNCYGYCLRYGDGVAAAPEQAVEWFLKAAEQGLALAQYNLGDCYESGSGVRKSAHQAIKWYRKAAEQGQADAQCALACHYAWGISIPGDMDKAADLFRRAAKQGHAEAQRYLARCYAMGAGVRKSESNARYWYRRAARQGDEVAIHELEEMNTGGAEREEEGAQTAAGSQTDKRRWWHIWKTRSPQATASTLATPPAAKTAPADKPAPAVKPVPSGKPAAAGGPAQPTAPTAAQSARRHWWQVWKKRTPAPAAEAAPVVRVYYVRKGDNLTHIARALKVPLRSLAAENGLSINNSVLRVGQKLRIPATKL